MHTNIPMPIFILYTKVWILSTVAFHKLNPYFWLFIVHTFNNYLLPKPLVFTSSKIIFFVSLLFVAVVNPFDPSLPLIFLIFHYFTYFVYFLWSKSSYNHYQPYTCVCSYPPLKHCNSPNHGNLCKALPVHVWIYVRSLLFRLLIKLTTSLAMSTHIKGRSFIAS